MRRFYAPHEAFTGGKINLSYEETRHLRDVLRLRENAEIQIFDGAGNEFLCVIVSISKKNTELKIIDEIAPAAPESSLDLTLAVALLKGEKFDFVIQKAVELGVSTLIPLNTKRADVKIKDAEKKTERWGKIIIEAAKQCGRAKLMSIQAPIDYAKYIESAEGTKILFAEHGGSDFSAIETGGRIIGVIGSEGGWEDSEIEVARTNDFQIITFGGRVLRAETAAVSIAAVLQHRFGDFN